MKAFLSVPLRWVGYFFAVLFLCVGLYLACAQWIGAWLEGPVLLAESEAFDIESGLEATSKTRRIYLVAGFLHTDIALPVDGAFREKMRFLESTAVPMDHPNLKFVLVGLGSRAFYTTAGTYWDIRPSAVVRAVTGDSAVLRFTAAGPLEPSADVIPLDVTQSQLDRLMAIVGRVMVKRAGMPSHLKGTSIGPYDAFFEAKGAFNLFNPCNQWVNETLRATGLRLGRWTPTTAALVASLNHFGHVKR